MTDLTPRNNFPYPSEREQPHWESFKAGVLAEDAAHYANADNGNLTFLGGGIFGWDASTDTLFWTEDAEVSGFHTAFRASIPTGSIVIQEDEVVFFEMPRLLTQNAELTLYRSSRIFAEGVRLHDLRLFAMRSGDTIYFMNGLSLKDGDTGVLFGGGLFPRQTVLPHQHEDAWLYVAPAPGIINITPQPIITSPDLFKIDVFRAGILLVEGVGHDYTFDFGTGVITLTTPTVASEKFVVHRETRDTTVAVSSHEHAVKLILTPTPGTSVLSVLATAPILLRVDVFRNGQLLVEGSTHDYTVDLTFGLVTLSAPSLLGDKFELHRYLGIV